jgi:hypothetical protein
VQGSHYPLAMALPEPTGDVERRTKADTTNAYQNIYDADAVLLRIEQWDKTCARRP